MNKRHTLPCLFICLLTLLGTISVAVAQSTADQWNRFKQKSAKGLNIDANAILDSLEATAHHNGDTLLLLHVHVERGILLNSYSQHHEKDAIFYIDSVMQHSTFPYRNLYERILSQYLYLYQTLNYVKIAQRKVTSDTALSHLDEWPASVLQNAIVQHQQASQANGEMLKKYPLQDFLFLFPDSMPQYLYESSSLYDMIFGPQADTNSIYDKAVRYYEMALHSNEDNDWMLQAHTLFTQLLNSPKSLERHNAAAYLQAIESQYIQSFKKIRSDLHPSAKLLVPIEYCNIDTLYVTCFKKKQNTLKIPSDRNPGKYLQFINEHPIFSFSSMAWLQSKNLDSLRTERFILPSKHNYLAQSTDLFLDSLGNGNYLIVFHNRPDIDTNSMLHGVEFSICDKSIVYEGIFKHKKHYRVLDAASGASMSNVKVLVTYNGITHHTRHSNNNGIFNLPYTSTTIFIPEAKNSMIWKQIDIRRRYRHRSHPHFYRSTQKLEDNLILLTDRTIYRPGQTMYFKAILFNTLGKKKACANNEIEVCIIKNDSEKICSMQLVTNAFGSIDSCIILPQSLTPGNYKLSISSKKHSWRNYAFFNVEEYKRPSFELSMDTIKDVYTLGDTVNLWGKATYYSGVPVPGATARVRVDNINHEWSAITNAAGYFHVAIPTALLPETNQYSRRVVFTKITVTDPSGETHTTHKNFLVGGDCLTLQLKSSSKIVNILTDSVLPVSISLTNQDWANISDTFQVRVYRLDVPARQHILFSHDKPSMPLYSESEYQRYFPNYSFNKNECLPEKFNVLSTVWEQTTTDTNFALNVQNWVTGRYKLVVQVTDPHGKQVQDSIFFSVIGKGPFKQTNILHAALLNEIDASFKATGMLHYTIGCSTIPNANIYYYILYNKKIVKQGHLIMTDSLLTDSVHVCTFPTVAHSNAQIVAYTFLHNHLYSSKDEKEGYFENKLLHDLYRDTESPLKIQVEHLNNKLNPGNQETWSFTITGKDSTQHPAAEMVAFMFDASLDQLWFLKNNISEYDNTQTSILRNFQKRKYSSLLRDNSKFRLNPECYNNQQCIMDKVKPQPKLSLWNRQLPTMRTTSTGFYDYPMGYQQATGNGCIKGRVQDQTGQPLAYTQILLTTPDNRVICTSMSDQNGNYALYQVPTGTFTLTAEAKMTCKKTMSKTNVVTRDNSVIFIDFDIDCASELEEVTIKYEPPVFDADRTTSTVRGNRSDGSPVVIVDGVRVRSTPGGSITSVSASTNENDTPQRGFLHADQNSAANQEASFQARQELLGNLQPRTNFAETAFFLPKLRTDKQGRITFQFKAPDQLTRWHFLALAHTKNHHITTFKQDVCTQRALMVIPNTPRFVREGDTLLFRSNILTVNRQPLHGDTHLEMWDTLTQQHLSIANASQSFQCDSTGSALSAWNIAVPHGIRNLQYKLAAVGTMPGYTYSDGESRSIPVLPQVIDLNETLPFHIAKDSSQHVPITFTANGTRTLHISTHPTWAIFQALPNLIKSRHESNDELMYKFAANTLAKLYLKQHPHLLQHAALDDETRDLFDTNRINKDLKKITQDLQAHRNINGSWGWFNNSGSDAYITTRIVTLIGQLSFLVETTSLDNFSRHALHYLCQKEMSDYARFVLDTTPNKQFHFGPSRIQFLYALSYYTDWHEEWLPQEQLEFYLDEAEKHYRQSRLQDKAMIAIACHRLGRSEVAEQWAESLRQQASRDAYGLSWTELKRHQRGWHDVAINTEAILMELLFEALPNTTDDQLAVKKQTVADITQWLLAQRTTNHWGCNSTNTAVCYALALTESPSSNTTDSTQLITIRYGNTLIQHPDTLLCGTYVLPNGQEKTLSIENHSTDAVYGSVWLEYRQSLDSVKTFGNDDIMIKRTLHRRNYNDKQTQWEEITTGDTLRVGDILTIRFVIENARNMDYVNISDMRACSLEPSSQASQWRSNGDLRWYESPHDYTTEFYITHLERGTHILEYTLNVTQVGTFRNGTATIESMLAPEFTAHSDSPKIIVIEQ